MKPSERRDAVADFASWLENEYGPIFSNRVHGEFDMNGAIEEHLWTKPPQSIPEVDEEPKEVFIVLDIASKPSYIRPDTLYVNVRLVTEDREAAEECEKEWKAKGHVVQMHGDGFKLGEETPEY